MRTGIVFTLTGPDRVGIVEEVTAALLRLGGNVETSRMARLGGEFAILMLVSLPKENVARVEPLFASLATQGYRVSVSEAPGSATGYEGWLPYRVQVTGADHEGIVNDIARGLAENGITIESMETAITPAPVSGAPLFTMTALVLAPPSLDVCAWTSAIDTAASHANVDVTVAAAD